MHAAMNWNSCGHWSSQSGNVSHEDACAAASGESLVMQMHLN